MKRRKLKAAVEESSRSRALPGAQDGAASRLVNRIIDLLDAFNDCGYGASLNDPILLSKICLSLARGIDHAIANNEVPLRSRDLPLLLYRVLGYTNDASLKKASMRLIKCIDGACSLHWFSNQDTATLLRLSEKLFGYYSATTIIRFSRSVHSSVEKVMSRFYPNMKMDETLISLELQPGLGSYAAHFYIIRGMVDPKQDKIWIFGAQIDNIDTSSCIITLPEVNFLLNEKLVVGRNLGSMDKASQLPTDVTHMMKYGINMLQVDGDFPGQFLVIIAIMHTVPCSDAQELQNYVTPAALNNSEAAIIETPSVISLHCPISPSRMRTPVKGQLCEHPEVLMEAKEKVSNVNLSPDGSWEKIEDHSAARDALLHDHNKNGSAVGNSIQNQTISCNLNVSVDSYMTNIATSAIDMPADDRARTSDNLTKGKQIITSKKEEHKRKARSSCI